MAPTIYLHGFASGPGSSKARFFNDYLTSHGIRPVIPDLAAGDFEHLTLTGQLAVIEEAAAGRAVALIGSSMGGYLAALYAARHPEVERLVLLAPGFAFARRWPEYLGSEKMAAWRRDGSIEMFHYAENRTRNLHYGLQTDAERYEPFPEFQQPALLFHGRNDEVIPVRSSEEFAASRPNVRLEVLDSGHELLDVLDYMAPKVYQFLNG